MGNAEKGTNEEHGLYESTPSQAEGERDESSGNARSGDDVHPMAARTEPSQAEGERTG
ncbi:hypothetical protein [Streptomyces sp. NBC_00102]|uniref:hypothetical protein n=1 Tax=Streptomyces sp. NBC_00102 TaxID=2975652 RepID=UPI00224EF736|nr:hypothetical protein [Streptomyces sp. NBC_00102]MCX5401208.1 hypothetical protein [Streptomyces sp. NBC_00102]